MPVFHEVLISSALIPEAETETVYTFVSVGSSFKIETGTLRQK